MITNSPERSFYDRIKNIVHEQLTLAEDLIVVMAEAKEEGHDGALLKKLATAEAKNTLVKTLNTARRLKNAADRMQIEMDLGSVD